MRRAWQQIIGGIVATIIFSLMALTPVWIAETIEGVETARSGIKTFEEVVSETTTTWNNGSISTYEPYLEWNETTTWERPEDIPHGIYHNGFYSHWGFRVELHDINNYVHDNEPTYNYDGTKDIIYLPEWAGWSQVFELNLLIPSFQQLIDDNVDKIYIYWDTPLDVFVNRIFACGVNSWGEGQTYTYFDNTADGIRFSTNQYYTKEWILDIDSTELNNAAANCDSDDLQFFRFLFEIGAEHTYNGLDPWIFDIQLSPSYYEETEVIPNSTTSWTNYTKTTYVPYILEASNPYTWIQWGLGFSGVFFLLTAAVINPIINPGKVLSRATVNLPGRKRRS